MAEIISWQGSTRHFSAIDQAVRAIDEGLLVGIPTDTTYAAAASVLSAEAIERLARVGKGSPLTVAVPTAGHALDWVPEMSSLGRRLARRCWPGPIRLLFNQGWQHGLLGQVPDPVRRHLCVDGSISLYVPLSEAITEMLMQLGAPLALACLETVEEGPPASATQVQELTGTELALIVDAGPCSCTRPLSAVRVNGQQWTMLQEGAVSREDIARRTTCVILFVCTGNTCRSPMAEALCRKLLADRLGCSAEELPQRGYLIVSAGLAAASGDPAAPEAIEVMEEMGATLSGHVSRPLTADLVLLADHVMTMTRSHQLALLSRFGRHLSVSRLLSPHGQDIADPVGAGREVYRQCAQEIRESIEHFLREMPGEPEA